MEKGFTLIELIIVVAMIGILSAISIVSYQNYMARSQISIAFIELRGARPQYELIINDGSTISDYTVLNMFFASNSKFCTYAVYAPVGGGANPALECTLKNVIPVLAGEKIFLSRNINGAWSCSTSNGIPEKFKPRDCI